MINNISAKMPSTAIVTVSFSVSLIRICVYTPPIPTTTKMAAPITAAVLFQKPTIKRTTAPNSVIILFSFI